MIWSTQLNAATPCVSPPPKQYEYHEIKEAIELEEELGQISWLALFRTPGNRRRMRIIIALGFVRIFPFSYSSEVNLLTLASLIVLSMEW